MREWGSIGVQVRATVAVAPAVFEIGSLESEALESADAAQWFLHAGDKAS